ncbi:membrane-associated HD superfamily phosphohydrolase [Paenibacillus sp. DS2015]|uniref:hypothetical protein n=1 Tax=Paenibacillus sp. DS2015 TaxID=3373917 RepID=UPI003D2578B1
MFSVVLRKYSFIAKSNLKHNFLVHVTVALLILCLTPFIFGISNLDAAASAAPLEMFVALIGIVLLTPVFMPEQQKDIRELIETKYTSQTGIYFVRAFTAVVTMLVMILCFVVFMRFNGSTFPLIKYLIGTFSGAVFLGAMGMFFSGISDNIAVGYMIPLFYYVFNMSTGSKYVGNLYLFSMSSKGSFEEKYWLMGTAIFLVLIALLIKKRIRKVR